MSRRLAASVLAIALFVPAGAHAAPAQASTTQPARPKLGLGVAVVPFALSNLLGGADLFVPFQASPNLRIEPSIGILTADSGPVSENHFAIGVGVLGQSRVGTATDLQYGGRLKIGFASVNTDGPGGDDSGTDLVIAAAAGGEHWLADHFSLGFEAQLGYYSLSPPSGDVSGLFTAGVVLVRLYL
jgi:hypothetical protein